MIPRLWGLTAGGDDLPERVRAALDAGLPAVLVREPALPDALLPVLAGAPGRAWLHARMPGAAAVAAAMGFGLHLPGDADPVWWRARFPGRLGRSCHAPAEARAALAAGLDHVFLSPIWPPTSKPDDRRAPLGPAALHRLPRTVALGGVTPERVGEALAHGAAGVAVLGGIFAKTDVAAAVRAYSAALASYDQIVGS